LKKLPAERFILDGEIAALDEKRPSSFQLLQLFKKSGDAPLVSLLREVTKRLALLRL
jgi:ATP-dependent DNA ligase